MSDRRRYALIAVAVALMAAAIWIGGELVRQTFRLPSPVEASETLRSPDPAELPVRIVLPDPYRAARLTDLPGTAELAVEYGRRSFPGAPPTIPHEVEDEGPAGGDCLTCHRLGGYAPTLKAYSPPTPHPHLLDCRQCHVTQKTEELFRVNAFRGTVPPPIKRAALPGAPPPIPHSLQMRETCLSCHAGPSSARQIRTPHPERTECQLCHVAQNVAGSWSRNGGAP